MPHSVYWWAGLALLGLIVGIVLAVLAVLGVGGAILASLR